MDHFNLLLKQNQMETHWMELTELLICSHFLLKQTPS